MTYTIDQYFEDIPLQQGDKVHLSLNPTSNNLDSIIPNRHELSQYVISLDLIINNNKHTSSLPLASVLKTSHHQRGYGNAEEKISALSKIICNQGFSRGAIITPFFEPSPLGLECGMSSNSIVYILSGLIEYTHHIAKKIDHINHPNNIILGNKLLTPKTLNLLIYKIKGTFHGYQARLIDDYDLLKISQGHIPAQL